MPDFDFGFNGTTSEESTTVENKTTEEITDIDSNKPVDKQGEDVVDINESADTTKGEDDKPKEDKSKGESDDDKVELLEEGTIVEYGDKKYTADGEGNLVDDQGKVFKKADKVNEWLSSLQTEEVDDNDAISIDAIKKVLGVEIEDENGKPIEFENTVEGVTSYVNSYIENTRAKIAEDTIAALYNKYPIIENVLNYYIANGNSLEGFNEVKDRSTITLDTSNIAQCEAIIKEAWKEDGRKGNVDSYIQYLKSQNLLGVTAEEELQAMVARDKEEADNLARRAKEKEEADIEAQTAYWNDINKRILVDKKIGKYQIPDTIIRVHNGQKTSATPQDFYNYIFQVDKYGRSQYENDLINDSNNNPEGRLVNDMIAAYLRYTGGSYESLVNMAINEEKVKTIKVIAKANKTTKNKAVKVTTPTKGNKIPDFGF